MRYKRTITITAAIAVAILAAFGILHEIQPVEARTATVNHVMPVDPTPTPCPEIGLECYEIKPSDTDGPNNDGSDPCPGTGIGCDVPDDIDPLQWGNLAPNGEHFLYLPSDSKQEGKLLVFLCGGKGSAGLCENVAPVAARQGYHVIGLTYPTGVGACVNANLTREERLACFGDFITESVTGECPNPDPSASIGCQKSHISEHPQDSVVNRLIKVLEWAHANHPGDGWNRYFPSGTVDWTQVHLAGHSNGSSYVSRMGTLDQFRSVGRVSLFAGPNDGEGVSELDWTPSDYIRRIDGVTDTRYYGLVHKLNKAENDSDDVLYEVVKAWQRFGMERPLYFLPSSTTTPADFDGEYMLISRDPDTTFREAHNSVVFGVYCEDYEPIDPNDPAGDDKCVDFGNSIGYEPAWRCLFGTGNADASTDPTANAGTDQTVECTGNGGAYVDLDASGSRDADCDILGYEWTVPFGIAVGRNPSVFCPLGMSPISLIASDDWGSSPFDTTDITVEDTQPPSLQVSLTPTVLWPANHKMVRIDATVNVADSCGGTPPQVALVSIVSSQPDNGPGSGNTVNDIQDAQIETFDTSFLLRAEREGGDPAGRIYTMTYRATDSSGNKTFVSKTVHVPHSH